MSRTSLLASSLLALTIAGCAGHTRAPAHAPVSQTPALTYSGLSSPESALYDPTSDRYLISNVNGGPLAKDNNGFISVLSPTGEISALKWIEGGKNGVTLDGPKGMTIAGGVLYVADISSVRTFDLATGAKKGEIAIAGSTWLSDLTTSADGKVYLTDAGAPIGRFDGVGTEAVYVIEQGKAKIVSQGKLGRPSGLLWSEDGLVVSPFGANELYRLDENGKKADVTKLPAGGLTGLVALDDTLYVTSWQSSSVYQGKLGGEFVVAIAGQTSPGDLALDTKRARLLVPRFDEDRVEAFDLR